MIIGYVSKSDPYHDRVAWSGTVFKVREAIELAGFKVIWIPYGRSKGMLFYDYLIRILNHTFFRRKKLFGGIHFGSYAKACAKNIENDVLVSKCDYLFFTGGAEISLFLNSKKPVIYLTDATLLLLLDYYDNYNSINNYSRRAALDLNCRAAQHAQILIRSSQWAVNSLINDYHCDKDKCHVLEFGPNLDTKDILQNEPYQGGELRILFSGLDWIRKGGDIAVETVEILRHEGLDAKLIVAGPRKIPVSCINKKYIEFVGYLNKNNPFEYKRCIKLYKQCHVFLLPTKAECSAIVYSEAAAAGLPCYTYLTGGTGNYVINGINGYAFPEGSPATVFAEKIISDVKNNNIIKLREGAFILNKEKLSWEAWANGFKEIIRKNNPKHLV